MKLKETNNSMTTMESDYKYVIKTPIDNFEILLVNSPHKYIIKVPYKNGFEILTANTLNEIAKELNFTEKGVQDLLNNKIKDHYTLKK